MDFERTELLELVKGEEHNLVNVLFIQQHGSNPFYVSTVPFSETNPGLRSGDRFSDIVSWDTPVNKRVRAHEETKVLIGYGSIAITNPTPAELTNEEFGQRMMDAIMLATPEDMNVIKRADGSIAFVPIVPNIEYEIGSTISSAEALSDMG